MTTIPQRACAFGVLALAMLAVAPALAAARGWSTPKVLQPTCGTDPLNCVVETAPRVAVNTRGDTVVAWVDNHQPMRVHVVTGDGHGRFAPAVTLDSGLRPAVAITADGTATVAWSDHHNIVYSRRRPGHSFAHPAVLAASPSKLGDDDAKAAAQPDGSTVVVYQNAYRTPAGKYVTRLRSVRLPRSGRPGRPTDLGDGFVNHDSFRAAADGQLAICCVASPATPGRDTAAAAYAPSAGWSTLAVPLGPRQQIETVGPGRGDLAFGAIDVHNSGDAGTLGVPGLFRADAHGAFAAPLTAPVVNATRAFGPVVAIDGSGRNVLVYQEKDAPAAFSRVAPVYAVTGPRDGAFGARQVLDRSLARQLAVRTYGTGAVAAWEAPGHRWRVAVERGGVFSAAPAPAGGPSNVGEDFNYSRDMATGGRYVALTWTAIDGSIRVSVGVL